MTEKEVILVDNIPKELYTKCFDNALNYALISCPFTYNRMKVTGHQKKIENILKGKLAEGIFQIFTEANGLAFDFDSTRTDFRLADKRDFLHGAVEYDIKNNFLHHIGTHWYGRYTSLAALIPDNHDASQWSKRNILYHSSSQSVGYVFSFMKLSSKYKGPFFDLKFTNDQNNTITRHYRESIKDPVFPKLLLQDLGKVNYEIRQSPTLVITAIARREDFHRFKEGQAKPLTYGNGVMRTIIKNQICRIGALTSFYQSFGLNDLIYARLKPSHGKQN